MNNILCKIPLYIRMNLNLYITLYLVMILSGVHIYEAVVKVTLSDNVVYYAFALLTALNVFYLIVTLFYRKVSMQLIGLFWLVGFVGLVGMVISILVAFVWGHSFLTMTIMIMFLFPSTAFIVFNLGNCSNIPKKEERNLDLIYSINTLTGKNPDWFFVETHERLMFCKVGHRFFTEHGLKYSNKIIYYKCIASYLEEHGKKYSELSDEDLQVIQMIDI